MFFHVILCLVALLLLGQAAEDDICKLEVEGYAFDFSSFTSVELGTGNALSVSIHGCSDWKSPQQSWTAIDGNIENGIQNVFNFTENGDTCKSGRVISFQARCNKSLSNEPMYSVSSENADPCHITFTLISKNKMGCYVEKVTDSPASDGGNSDGSGWSFFSSVFTFAIVVLALYCCFGIVQNIRYEGRSGLDAVPHQEFLYSLFIGIVDLAKSSFEALLNFIRGRSGGHDSFNIEGRTPFTGTIPHTNPSGSYQNIDHFEETDRASASVI